MIEQRKWRGGCQGRAARQNLLPALATYIAQSTLLGLTLHVSARESIVSDIIDAAGVQRGFTVVRGEVIEICYEIPSLRGTPCDVVYNGTASGNQVAADTVGLAGRDVSVTPFVDSAGTTQGVVVSGLSLSSSLTTLSLQCVESLTWLETFLRDAKSEGIIQIVFQCWLFSISLVALIMESIPHFVVVLASHGAVTAWSIFRLYSERAAETTYDDIVSGACDGADVLGGWPSGVIQYAIIGINGSVFLCTIFLVYRLEKVYGKEMFSSVGSSPAVTRILKLLHRLTVFLRFASFYIVVSAAAWFDKRKTGIVPPYSHSILQDAAFVVVCVIIPPWFCLGLRSIPLEQRGWFLIFFFLTAVLLVFSALSFTSALFRYEIGAWSFLGCLSIIADLLLVVSCILALVCRVHFGLGLKQFLVVQAELRKSGFAQDRFVLDPNRVTVTITSTTTTSAFPEKIKFPYDSGGRPVSPTPLRHDKSESDSLSERSKCSVHSETFVTWLAAAEKYGLSDEEKNKRSERSLDYPRFPPGLGHVATPIVESALRREDTSTWEGKEPEFGDDESGRLSVASVIVVRETEVSSVACRSEPACKARL
ncbi:hypothetical protein BKA83DRAFT_4305775 [Pisolithus microcarpus]|nr:hypothetical protein BKA83DRAFT_4305775 [Pisolithus microcarpus]